MFLQVLKSKIHRANVTEANLNYVGSVTIDEELMKVLQRKKGLQEAVYALVRNKTKKSGH